MSTRLQSHRGSRGPGLSAASSSRCPVARAAGPPAGGPPSRGPAGGAQRARSAVAAQAVLRRACRDGTAESSTLAIAGHDGASQRPRLLRLSRPAAPGRRAASRFGSLASPPASPPSRRASAVATRAGKRPGAGAPGSKGGKPSPSGGGAPKAAVVARVKLSLTAGKATPAPPVGPALGSKGVNLGKFCSEYNAMTRDETGVVPVVVTIRDDRSFSLELKTPPTSALLKVAAGVRKGATKPGQERVGRVTESQVAEIAVRKMPDLNCTTHDAAVRMVKGTARGMGIEVVPDDWTEAVVQEESQGEESEGEDWSDDDGAGSLGYRELGPGGEGWDDAWLDG